MLDNQFNTVIASLVRGEMSVEQAYALASERENSAQFYLGMALSQSLPATPRGGADRLLELAWRVFGIRTCIRYRFPAHQANGVMINFIRQKLHGMPDEFDDELLDSVWLTWKDWLGQDIDRIRTRRLKSRADSILQQPRELGEDLRKVQEYVSAYNFHPDLNSLLAKVEAGILAGGDQFDQSALLKHLRTFFEKLHRQVAEKLHTVIPSLKDGTDLAKFGQAIDYLCRKDVLTDKMRELARALYGVLSNEGVHAIKSEREYVRLCRNMVAEYALVLFFELDRQLMGSKPE